MANAVNYTKIGSIKVTVSLEEPLLIKISVKDTGIGIDEELQSKLFDSY